MKLSDFLSNISGLAALAIIIAGVGGFFIVIAAAALGNPLAPEALALIDRFVNILIGLAVGAGAGSGATAVRIAKAQEAQADAMKARNYAEQDARMKGEIHAEARQGQYAYMTDPPPPPSRGPTANMPKKEVPPFE